jgi:hypothetical protein
MMNLTWIFAVGKSMSLSVAMAQVFGERLAHNNVAVCAQVKEF